MKKILLFATIFIMLFPSISVYAETQTPEAPVKKRQSVHQKRNVACPPSYVGQSATCVFIPNPKFDDRTVTTPRRQIPTTNPTALYWAMYGAMDIMSKTEAGKQAVDTFWNDVDKVDQTAGQILNKLIDGNVDTSLYEDAWNTGLMAGNKTATISTTLYDALWDATTSVLGGIKGFESVKDRSSDAPIHFTEAIGIVTVKGNIMTVSTREPYAFMLWSGSREYGSSNFFSCQDTCNLNGGYQRIPANMMTKPTSIATAVTYMDKIFKYNDSSMSITLYNKDTAKAVAVTKKSRTYPNGVTAHGNVIDISIPPSIGTEGRELPEEGEVDGKPYIEDEVVVDPAKPQPFYIPPGIDRMPGLAPRKDTDFIFVPEAIVVEKGTGKIVNPDGTVGKNPVTDPDGLVTPKPSPVQPPNLPPKETKAPTGEELPNKDAEEEGNRWKMLVTNKFPFSLPWDIYNVISLLTADAERPEIDIDIRQRILEKDVPIKFKHDFLWMDSFIPFVRTFILIGFSLFLILKTRTLMGGGQ